MKKKTVKLILSVVILFALCGAYFVVHKNAVNESETESEESDDTQEIFSVSSDDITSLKFFIDEKETSFVKEDNTWYKEDEKEFPVDQDVLSGAVSSCSLIKADRILENVDNLSEYDLDNPSNTITLTTKDGDQTEIRVGMKNDSTSQYYILLNDTEDKVYVIGSAIPDAFSKSLYDYAKSGEFPEIDSNSITSLSVENEEGSYILEKDPDIDLWYINSGQNRDKADTASVSTLTGSIGSLTFESFADYNCTDDSKYGFDHPYAVLKVAYQTEETSDSSDSETTEESSDVAGENTDGSEDPVNEESESSESESSGSDSDQEISLVDKELTLYIGSQCDDSRYVKVDDSKEVYTLSIGTISGLVDKKVSDYWDLTVNYLSVNQLDSLTIEKDSESHVVDVSRETNESQDTEEDDTSATTTLKYQLDGEEITESSKFTTFYNKLINLMAQERLTDPYEPDKDANMKVKFEDLNGDITEIAFYEYDVNFYAAVVNDSKVYLINKMNYKDLEDAYGAMISQDEEE